MLSTMLTKVDERSIYQNESSDNIIKKKLENFARSQPQNLNKMIQTSGNRFSNI